MSSLALISPSDLKPTTSQFLDLSFKKPRRKHKIKETRQCLVCGENVVHKHFGAKCCASCAAFFRRSVSQKRSYFCRQSEACRVDKCRHKNRCAFCRFNRCLEIGMDMNKVISSGIVIQAGKLANQTTIGTFQRHHNAIFTLRRKFAIQLFGSYKHMFKEKRTARTFLPATEVETFVMKEFYRSIGLIDTDLFNTTFEKEFCAQMLPLWMLLEIIFISRAHSGHRSRKLYYVDDSYLEFNEDSLLEFYNSHQDVYHPESLARTCMHLYDKYFKVIELIHKFAIDDFERIVIMTMSLYRRAVFIAGPNQKMQNLLNVMFKDLKLYYENTFNSLPLRLANLISCVEAIEEAHTKIVQQLTIVSLNLKNVPQSQNCYSVSYYKG